MKNQFDNNKIAIDSNIAKGAHTAQERLLPCAKLVQPARITRDALMNVIHFSQAHQPNVGAYKIWPIGNKVVFEHTNHGASTFIMASPGNGGRALSSVCRAANLEANIVVPVRTALESIKSLSNLGANVILHGESFDESYAKAMELSHVHGHTFINPYNEELVFAGNGAMGLEILGKFPDIEQIVIPIGGGGLSSGVTSVLKAHKPSLKIIGVQSAVNSAMAQSISSGHHKKSSPSQSLAFSMAVGNPGDQALEILLDGLDDVVLVSEEEIMHAMAYYMAHGEKIEGAGATPLAALLSGKITNNKNTLLLVSGGNMPDAHKMQISEYEDQLPVSEQWTF